MEKGYRLDRCRDPVRHSPPFKGRGRGGVCNVSNFLSAKSGGEEVSAKSGGEEWAAKKWQQRSGSKEVAAKNITDITDPTPNPSP